MTSWTNDFNGRLSPSDNGDKETTVKVILGEVPYDVCCCNECDHSSGRLYSSTPRQLILTDKTSATMSEPPAKKQRKDEKPEGAEEEPDDLLEEEVVLVVSTITRQYTAS